MKKIIGMVVGLFISAAAFSQTTTTPAVPTQQGTTPINNPGSVNNNIPADNSTPNINNPDNTAIKKSVPPAKGTTPASSSANKRRRNPGISTTVDSSGIH